MSAIVFGAGGLIGYHVTRALVLEGFKVYGVVRKQFDADQLQLLGAAPLIGDASDAKVYEQAIQESSVVIDAGLADFSVLSKQGDPHWVTRVVLEATRKASDVKSGRPKRFIYTSGSASYDSKGSSPIDEQSPLSSAPFMSQTHKFTQELLALKDVIPIVVCPTMVYGGWFSGWDLLFSFNNETKELDFPGKTTKRLPHIHVNDLANAYALLATAPTGSVSNQTFLVASDGRERLIDIWQALAKAAGSNGKIKNVEPSNKGFLGFVENMDQVVNASKLKQLGWRARHASPVDSACVLYSQYVAWQKIRPQK